MRRRSHVDAGTSARRPYTGRVPSVAPTSRERALGADVRPATRRATVYEDESLALQTPELVELQLPIAGPASRLLAMLWDLLHLLVAEVLLLVVTAFVLGPLFEGIATALYVLAQFALLWGYRFWWEWRNDGQTPGKRKFGLRTVCLDGRGLTVREAALRQLLLVVDLQPMFTGVVGLLFVIFTKRRQRLGDMVAGTIVVRDLPSEFPLPAVREPGPTRRPSRGSPRLPDKLFEALTRYGNAGSLSVQARQRLEAQLVARCEEHVEPRGTRSPAYYLLRVVHEDEQARRHARALAGAESSVLAARLLERRRDAWERFRETCARLRRKGGLAELSGEQVRAFAAEHRAVAADLARARTYGADERVVWALQRTLATAHVLLHRAWGPAAQEHPLLHAFPRLVRRHARPLLLSALVFFGSAVVTFVWSRLDPALESQLVSQHMIERADDAVQRWEENRGYVDIPLGSGPIASASLLTNNVRVAFLAFAGGLVAGLGTLAILLLNGVHLGAVFAAFAARDAALVLTDFVMPHGVVELTAIVFAGGAGLTLGAALLDPGRRERWTLLRERARDVIGLMLGVVVMLVFAALTEAFVSPRTDLSVTAKAIYSASTAALLLVWIAWGGRARLTDDADA